MNSIRRAVSMGKRRFVDKENGFDLDLSFSYYQFSNHHPPPFAMIEPLCADIQKYLSENTENTAVIHCKAGKGRTGTIICCYLLYVGICKTSDEAMQVFAQKRSRAGRGLTIKSQIRYLRQFEVFIRRREKYVPKMVKLQYLTLQLSPWDEGVSANISQPNVKFITSTASLNTTVKLFCSERHYHSPDASDITLSDSKNSVDGIFLSEDVLVTVFKKTTFRKTRLFQFWFNTAFLNQEGKMFIPRHELCHLKAGRKKTLLDELEHFGVEISCLTVKKEGSWSDLISVDVKEAPYFYLLDCVPVNAMKLTLNDKNQTLEWLWDKNLIDELTGG
ncbi:hypothetical protein G9A89_002926 [Geosiphon pyriformis]|nr:hypothetical protein G9A89_002926 [Geosiphon pyriformis]